MVILPVIYFVSSLCTTLNICLKQIILLLSFKIFRCNINAKIGPKNELNLGNACHHFDQSILSSCQCLKCIQNSNIACHFIWVRNLFSLTQKRTQTADNRMLRKIFEPNGEVVVGEKHVMGPSCCMPSRHNGEDQV